MPTVPVIRAIHSVIPMGTLRRGRIGPSAAMRGCGRASARLGHQQNGGGSTRKMAGRIFGPNIDSSIAARCCACLTVVISMSGGTHATSFARFLAGGCLNVISCSAILVGR